MEIIVASSSSESVVSIASVPTGSSSESVEVNNREQSTFDSESVQLLDDVFVRDSPHTDSDWGLCYKITDKI